MKIISQNEFLTKDHIDKGFVYHGSTCDFNEGIPYPVSRGYINENGIYQQTYQSIGFQATGELYIALAYTYTKDSTNQHNMGVSLYEQNNMISMIGPNSLEESILALYNSSKIRYLYAFKKEDFIQEDGLGDLELTCKSKVIPEIKVIITDTLSLLKYLRTKIIFIKNQS